MRHLYCIRGGAIGADTAERFRERRQVRPPSRMLPPPHSLPRVPRRAAGRQLRPTAPIAMLSGAPLPHAVPGNALVLPTGVWRSTRGACSEDSHGSIPVRLSAVAEFTAQVQSPRPERPIGRKRHRGEIPQREGLHVVRNLNGALRCPSWSRRQADRSRCLHKAREAKETPIMTSTGLPNPYLFSKPSSPCSFCPPHPERFILGDGGRMLIPQIDFHHPQTVDLC